jgi:hypothetical protein
MRFTFSVANCVGLVVLIAAVLFSVSIQQKLWYVDASDANH